MLLDLAVLRPIEQKLVHGGLGEVLVDLPDARGDGVLQHGIRAVPRLLEQLVVDLLQGLLRGGLLGCDVGLERVLRNGRQVRRLALRGGHVLQAVQQRPEVDQAHLGGAVPIDQLGVLQVVPRDRAQVAGHQAVVLLGVDAILKNRHGVLCQRSVERRLVRVEERGQVHLDHAPRHCETHVGEDHRVVADEYGGHPVSIAQFVGI